jgi:hypothetical protein
MDIISDEEKEFYIRLVGWDNSKGINTGYKWYHPKLTLWYFLEEAYDIEMKHGGVNNLV